MGAEGGIVMRVTPLSYHSFWTRNSRAIFSEKESSLFFSSSISSSGKSLFFLEDFGFPSSLFQRSKKKKSALPDTFLASFDNGVFFPRFLLSEIIIYLRKTTTSSVPPSLLGKKKEAGMDSPEFPSGGGICSSGINIDFFPFPVDPPSS